MTPLAFSRALVDFSARASRLGKLVSTTPERDLKSTRIRTDSSDTEDSIVVMIAPVFNWFWIIKYIYTAE
jgi:hypothetical protein